MVQTWEGGTLQGQRCSGLGRGLSHGSCENRLGLAEELVTSHLIGFVAGWQEYRGEPQFCWGSIYMWYSGYSHTHQPGTVPA